MEAFTKAEAKEMLDAEIAAAKDRYKRRLEALKVPFEPDTTPAASPRALEAARLRQEGYTFRQIGEALSVSAGRARQLAVKGERETSVAMSELSSRSNNIVHRVLRANNLNPSIYHAPGKQDAQDLARLATIADLREMQNCGSKSIREIVEWCRSHGFDLRTR